MAPDLLSLLRGIDLGTPWFAPWAPWIAPVVQQVLSGRSVYEALNRTQDDLGLHSAVPVRFVAQAELPAGEAYEAYIARTQTVPTRDHVHDLLNGVCWLRFPATKRRLNHWQGEQIAQQGVGATCPPTDAAWDAQLAQQLAPDTLVPKPYVPLPILGIPGWHPEQLDPAYYEDRQVFRR